MESLRAAIPKAEQDPHRPAYHFHPPALWMNDPNGPIYYKGYYHLFYQHNPFDDQWGQIHWGHARSKDLVHWEHLPIALWPSAEKGEKHCYSGCARINSKGQPLIYYTKVSTENNTSLKEPNEQWAAIGDDDLIIWEKHPMNPILDLNTHGGPTWDGDWRDPFIFEEQGRTFMILGATFHNETIIPIYEAKDAYLVSWTYRGILYRLPRKKQAFFEVPAFFKLGENWVLISCPYGLAEYFVGTFDLDSYTFTTETRGLLNGGDNFYATNVLFDDKDRCILFAWVRGFKKGQGWNGCLALPRIFSIDAKGNPSQKPVPELKLLRDTHFKFEPLELKNTTHVVENMKGDTLEILASFEPGDAKAFGLKGRYADNAEPAVTIRYDGQTLEVADIRVPLGLTEDKETLTLHVFLDKSVMEVFVNNGRTCVTGVIDLREKDLSLEVFAQGGRATVRSLDIWKIKSIW
jgi:beta-fructofuranosidase